MTPALRKLSLAAHVSASVGWLGAVVVFLALSVAGLTSRDAGTVRGAYLAMDLAGRSVIVPLSLAALVTGVAQAIGTRWGLFKHYWVVVKLALTLGATALLLLHQFTAVADAARRAAGATMGTLPDVGRLGTQLVVDASLALLVLLAVTAISVFKPWGRIPHGWRAFRPGAPAEPQPHGSTAHGGGLPTGLRILLIVIGVLVAAFAALHLTGHGPVSHGR